MAAETGENKYAKYGQPSLDLVFSGEKKSLTDRVGNVTVDFTRSSTATYVGSDGLIKSAAVNEARFDHDKDGNGLGLLIEESRTNELTYSEDFTQSIWVKTNTTATANSGTAPDGTNTATFLAETNVSNYFATYYNSSSTFTDCATSIYVKGVGRDHAVLYFVNSNTDNVSALFDLVNLTVSFTEDSGSTYNSFSADIEALPNGWRRISMTVNQPSASRYHFRLGVSDGNTATGADGRPAAYTGDSTKGLLIWGAQSEFASFPTSYIPTTSGTSTRNADQALLNGTDVTSWYNIPEGTVYSEAMSPIDLTTSRLVWHFRDPGRKEHNADNGFQWYDVGTGYSTNGSTYVAGVSNKQSYAYSHITGSSTRACLNGAFRYDLAVNPSATASAHTKLSLGSNVGTNIFLNGYIKQFTYWPTRLSDSDLQRLTE